MYAKLVTKTTATSRGYINGLLGVITGSIANTSGLDANTFDTASSTIISTVPSGWEMWDNDAGAAIGNVVPSVIRSAWTDSNNYHKYLWVGNMNGATNADAVANQWLNWIPGEGWNTSTNTGNNMLLTLTARNANSNWYAVPLNAAVSSSQAIVISSSQSHLFVWTGTNDISPVYNGHIFLSEYTRDDAWNTVNNGYPAWYMEGRRGTAYDPIGCNGTIPRFRKSDGANANHVAMNSGGTAGWITYGNQNFLVVSKLSQYGNSQFFNMSSLGLSDLMSRTIFNGGTINNTTWSSDLKRSYPIVDIQLKTGPAFAANFNSIGALGSVTDKTPYIRAFSHTVWTTLDEIVIDGETWTLLKLGNPDSAVLVKQV